MARTSPTNLPADITSFIGRRQDVADVRRLVSASRLVTLTGAGGVGKTRLAVKAAGDLRGGFPDGVWLIELAAVRDGDDVAHAVADVLDLRAEPTNPLLTSLGNHLAQRKALLVLDNCEHVIGPVADLVQHLLRRCPALHVLATSRESFGLTGEHVVPVPALPFPDRDSAAGPDALLRFDSVGLFVERASAGAPGFALTPDNSADVVRICTALEGIPLAIELAAVRVRSLPLDAILGRLKDHSGPLGREAPRIPTHHRTLRASVEWSHELCSPQEQALWARLSVFSGGFDLDAALAVCSGPDETPGQVTDAIASLVDKSILVREPSASGGRYRMLETLREFGEEHLAAAVDGFADTAARHRDWFLALVEEASTNWLDADQPALMRRLHEDYGNLRIAFARALTEPGHATSALVIAAGLEHYWLIRGWQSEGRQWLDEALAVAPGRTLERAQALRVDAYLTALQAAPDTAAVMASEARAIAAELGDEVELSRISAIDGVIGLCAGRVDEARKDLETALEGLQRARHPVGEAYTLVMLTAVAAAMEDASLAELCHRRCMQLTEPRNEAHLRAFSLWGRGIAALRDGDLDGALEYERDSLRLKRSIQDRLGMVLCIEALAWIDVERGADERAATLLGASGQFWTPMQMTIGSILDFGRFRAEYDGILADRLGPRRFEAAVRRGARMSDEQALRFALGEVEPEAAPASPLSPREQEIAQLVAQGLTNKRIALDLTLSQRTVEGHVEKIMTKLGFASRTQIAAWAAERRAADEAATPAR